MALVEIKMQSKKEKRKLSKIHKLIAFSEEKSFFRQSRKCEILAEIDDDYYSDNAKSLVQNKWAS